VNRVLRFRQSCHQAISKSHIGEPGSTRDLFFEDRDGLSLGDNAVSDGLLELVLTSNPGKGGVRRYDAGCLEAIAEAKRGEIQISILK
jgi:hypothetical protein